MFYSNRNFHPRLMAAFFATANQLRVNVYLDSQELPYFFHRSVPGLLAQDHGKPRCLQVKLLEGKPVDVENSKRGVCWELNQITTHFGADDPLFAELIKGCGNKGTRYYLTATQTVNQPLKFHLWDWEEGSCLLTMSEMD